MIDWRFTLNPDTDNIEAEEPAGWDGVSIKITRDKRLHGISIAYSVNELTFDGEAATFLKEQYEEFGFAAQVLLRIQAVCDDDVQYEETFQLDFKRYSEVCGDDCRVNIGFEQESCFSLFRSNYDKKVDVESETALDASTSLTVLSQLKKNLTLPPKAIRVIDEARTDPAMTEDITLQPSWSAGHTEGVVWPALQNVVHSGLGSFVTSFFPEFFGGGDGANFPPYDELPAIVNTTELLGDITCELQDTQLSFRMKGSIQFVGLNNVVGTLKVFRLPVGGDAGTPGDWVEEYSQQLFTFTISGTYPYDIEDSIPLTLAQGDLLYYYVHLDFGGIAAGISEFNFNQTTDCYFKLEATTICEESQADLFMIYETIHRVAEATTNQCLKLESEWYGRTDSQPDTYIADGCGALKTLTNGLKIRNAQNAKFFTSMKELMEELNKIDSIGFGLERNDADEQVLKVEKASHFYQDIELLRCPFVAQVKRTVRPDEAFGIIKVGYEKWKVEQLAGLDEFNSTREYRSDIQQLEATLDIVSKWVAAGYVIEITRQQGYAESGAADTKYDDDTFIICMIRAYGDFAVEQDDMDNPANMFDPDTVYNFRISPLRNLMRWFNMIAGQFRDVTDTESVFRFSAGTGNYLATGWMNDSCSPENATHQDNANVGLIDFNNTTEATPRFRPESDIFEYPLSLADFNAIRANPYGYISYQCGTNEWHKGFIFDIDYKICQGVANFDLREKYTQ